MNEQIMLEIIELSKGNAGTLKFLVSLLDDGNEIPALIIFMKLRDCPTIVGTNIYVLWSDLANNDIDTVVKLCENCPNDILEDACSRQDYSGRKLVKGYIE